jgi:hypothetical protein
MRKVENKIIGDIIASWHTRGYWCHEITKRDEVERTTNDIIHYRLHSTAIVTIVPACCTYRHVTDRIFDRMYLNSHGWRSRTTLSRFQAFLGFFTGNTIWEQSAVRNQHTLKVETPAKWYVAYPGQDPIEFEEHMSFAITRDF